MHSPDLTQSNIDKVAELFPTVVTERLVCPVVEPVETTPHTHSRHCYAKAIDFDLLRQELSDHVVEGPQERYQLDWPGKREALFAANAPIAKTLRPVREESVDFDTTKNIFIEGDNLDALKLLQESYLGKIKLIYIDPPYNTGNDFIYNDDFRQTGREYREVAGQVRADGGKLVSNTEANGRFHSDWLSMIYPRIKIARNLLTDDGVIIVSIDDNELANLTELMNQEFGRENFIATVVWQGGRKNDARFVSPSTDYMLMYARSASRMDDVKWREPKPGVASILEAGRRAWEESGHDAGKATTLMRQWWRSLPKDDERRASEHYNQIDGADGRPGVVFFGGDMRKPAPTSTSRYDVLHPVTGRPVNMHPNGWAYAAENMKRLLAEGRVKFGPDESTRPTLKRYLDEVSTQTVMPTFYADRRSASNRLADLMGEEIFDFPKDESVLARWFALATQSDPDAIVLDFFAGSGSTAHALMQLNAADEGRRRFILVQLPETIEHDRYATLADSARERLRRAGARTCAEVGLSSDSLDIGFRAFRVDSTNMADLLRAPDEQEQGTLALSTDSIKPGRTSEDLLFQVLLDWGLPLDLPIERVTLAGAEVFDVDSGTLVACFDDTLTVDVIRAIAEHAPVGVAVRDSAFADDSARINAEQIFREVSPDTVFKAI